MYKKNLFIFLKKSFFILITAGLAISLASCGGSSGGGGDASYGSLILNISSAKADSKAIEPGTDMNISTYDISGTGPGSEEFSVEDAASGPVAVNDLVAGAWAVTVSAKNTSGTVIASGSTAVAVVSGETATATVSVAPVNGTGTLTLSLSWEADLITNPSITASLTPVGSTETSITLTISGDSASFSDSTLNSGYYALNIILEDEGTQVWSLTDSVRIIAGETTSYSRSLTQADLSYAPGNIDFIITPDMQNPMVLSFDGHYASIDQGKDMTVTASATEDMDTCQWYLNGQLLSGEASEIITIGSLLLEGKYSLTLLATSGTVLSSGSLNFTVSDTPVNPGPVHYAQGIYFYDTDMDEGQVGGDITVSKALDETDITGYRIYWGSGSTEKLAGQGQLRTFEADTSDHSWTITNMALPEGATHLLVYTYNSNGESTYPVNVRFWDNVMNKVSVSSPRFLTVFKGKLYFSSPQTNGYELWCYDGVNDPWMLDEINESGNSSPLGFTVFRDRLYFQANDGIHGTELWVYDGENYLDMVSDIRVGSADSSPKYFTVFQDKLYFQASDGIHGRELWVYDGNNDPEMIHDLYAGASSEVGYLTVYNNKLYFSANDGIHGSELWVYDGVNRPSLVYDINQSGNSSPCSFKVFNNKLYFRAVDGANGQELWSYDGIHDPQMISNFSDAYSSIRYLTVFQDKLYYNAETEHGGKELWSCDRLDQISIVYDINRSSADSNPEYLTVYKDKLYFKADDGIHGRELWAYDGINNPSMVHDLRGGGEHGFPSYLTVFQDKLFFYADDGSGSSLWSYYQR